jgi:hypothetical protein
MRAIMGKTKYSGSNNAVMKKYKTYFSKEFLLIEVLMHFFVYRE